MKRIALLALAVALCLVFAACRISGDPADPIQGTSSTTEGNLQTTGTTAGETEGTTEATTEVTTEATTEATEESSGEASVETTEVDAPTTGSNGTPIC